MTKSTKITNSPKKDISRKVISPWVSIAAVWLRHPVSKVPYLYYPNTEVKKTMTEEEAEGIRTLNEKIRKEREEVCDQIATKFAQFKRDFLSAPIRKAMKCILDKKGQF